jgi:hypothetical protein
VFFCDEKSHKNHARGFIVMAPLKTFFRFFFFIYKLTVYSNTMSFDIPGYYFDKKKNKLFKLNPTGPYSLSEIRKRLKQEEEEEAAAKKKKRQQREKPIPSITQFIRHRTLFGSNKAHAPTHPGVISLVSHLKQKQALRLDGPKETYQSVKVDMDNDEFIMADKKGITRFGYQCSPQFQVWASGFVGDYNHLGNVTSLHYKQKTTRRELMPVNGTANHPSRGGTFFEYGIKQQPPLTQDERSTFSSIRNNDSILGIPNSHIENVDSIPLYEYRIKKDTFWSSSYDQFHDTTVVGGERKLHIINSGFEHAHSRSINSDVFALCATPTHQCWVGLRNGTIGSIDLRSPPSSKKLQQQRKKDKFNFKLKEASSITHIRCLDHSPTGNDILVTCLDGSVSIYDKRNLQNNPVRRLTGHHNETHHHLGFDIDEKNNLLMLAGNDGYVRIWSLFRTNPEPIFTSTKYSRPVPAVSFINHNMESMALHDEQHARLPGVILFGACVENKPFTEIEYFSVL